VYDARHAPFPQLLEAVLRAANPGADIEVIPLAVPGYSSHQGLAWLRRDIAWLRPDIVIACYGWNDINPRWRTDRETMSVDARAVLFRRLTGLSQALLHASFRWQRGYPALAAPRRMAAVTRVPAIEYVQNLREMARLSREHAARVIVVGPVLRDPITAPAEGERMARHREALRAAMNGDGTPYLEIPELTEAGWPANGTLFGERIHPNWLGHRLLANRLLETMEAQRMLATLKAPAPLPLS
jgi:lysophospholipase L1-like esterase